MPKPMLLTSVSTLPTACGGALAAVSAENCGESPATVMPHSSSHSGEDHIRCVQQPRRQQAAQAAQAQLPGGHARAADAPRPQAAADAADGADGEHGEGGPRQRRAGQARGQDRRHQHPQRVQLPHVAEVAEGRGAHLAVGPDAGQRAPLQPARRWPSGRGRSGTARNSSTPASAAARRDAEEHRSATASAAPARAHRMRAGAAQHQRADQPAQRAAQALREPHRRDLHAHRVDAGQEEAGERAPAAAGCWNEPALHAPASVQAAPASEHSRNTRRGAEAVGDGQQREHQRAGDEAQLHRRGERAHVGRGPAEVALQVGHDRVHREPRRGAGQLRQHDHRQHRAARRAACAARSSDAPAAAPAARRCSARRRPRHSARPGRPAAGRSAACPSAGRRR